MRTHWNAVFVQQNSTFIALGSLKQISKKCQKTQNHDFCVLHDKALILKQ